MMNVHVRVRSSGAMTEADVLVLPWLVVKALSWCLGNVTPLEPDHGVAVTIRVIP